jgi:hypothetical protein
LIVLTSNPYNDEGRSRDAAFVKGAIMPSPFPGMNPYLEQNDVWEDFHLNFISRSQEMLAGEVGPNYVVKIETRLYVHELSKEERTFVGKADVSVSVGPRVAASRSALAVAPAPAKIIFPTVDTETYTWIKILDRRNRRVVTAIELLSPTNKTPGPDRDDYLSKRSLYLHGPAHFIEIDLRRGGTRPHPPALPSCDYYVLLGRTQDRPSYGMWPLALRDRLPVIPVPLSPPDADVPLDLQAVLHRVYDAAQYGNYIYSEIPEPPLSAEDTAWAEQLVPKVQAGP